MKKETTIVSKVPNVVLRKKKLIKNYSLYLDIHHKGKRYKEYLKLYLSQNNLLSPDDKETLRLAEVLKTKKKLELQSEYHDEPDFNPKRKDFLPYLDHIISNSPQLKVNSIKKYKCLKNHIVRYDNTVITFKSIDKKWTEGLKNYFLKKCKRATADRYFSAFVTILNQAISDNIIKYNPANGIKRIGRDKSMPKFLTLEEVKLLSKTPMRNPEVKRAFLFSCFTSLRLSDIINLKWKNIYIQSGKTYMNFVQVKTGSEENNPISLQAIKLLGTRGKQDSPVFTLPNEESIRKSLKRWAKRAGINKDISFHWARHSFGTLSVISGIDIYTTSKLMGHSDVGVTQIYARVVDKMKDDAVTKLPTL